MAKTIDACGVSCPQPVLMTLNEIKAGEEDEIVVMVDSEASRENVSRAATGKGWAVAGISEQGGIYSITIKKG